MQMVRLVFILIAAAAGIGQYLQERYRMAVLEKLPGAEARVRYEAGRRRGERNLMVITVAASLVGLVALCDLLFGAKLGW